jgi:hypothetical protein
MSSSNASTVLVPLISLSVLSYLLSTVAKQAKRTRSGFVVEYGLPFKILGILSGLLTLFFCITYLAVKPEDKVAVLCLVILFAIISIPLLLLVFRTRIYVEGGVMIVQSPWRRTRRIPFSDVESIEFSKARQRHEIRTKEHGKVSLHVYLSGIPDLLAALGHSPSAGS